MQTKKKQQLIKSSRDRKYSILIYTVEYSNNQPVISTKITVASIIITIESYYYYYYCLFVQLIRIHNKI